MAWGLVYPDFFRTLMPFPWKLDRGQALEAAWQGNSDPRQPPLSGGFAWWREGANSGRLPGVIFNGTITETGQRLLLNTAGIDPEGDATKTFNQLGDTPGSYQNKDLAIATAARLSAAFSFVTPVARSDGDSGHIADGGYYDNYGMSTLIQWLRQALPRPASGAPPPVNEVMVIQIRSFPPDQLQARPKEGWLYQTHAPLDTLFSVRSAGQYAHNQQEFELLKQAKKADGITIYSSVFQFCATTAPVSWHLETKDVQALNSQWNTAQIDVQWKTVERFLNRTSLPEDVREPALNHLCAK